jgi:hypothetical protein
MKVLILFILVTATVSLFAHSRFSMTKNDLKMMNEIMDALDTPEVKLFAENATFDSVSVHYSQDGKTAQFEIHGNVIIQGDIACGDLHLTLDRVSHVSREASWNTYKAKLDSSDLAHYCELKYRDAKR